MKQDYEEIMHLPRPVSSKHPRMSMIDRAAQFSPFAALTGHNAAIRETARLTSEKVELDEYSKEVIRTRLQLLSERIQESWIYSITYFKPDSKKQGGSYVTIKDVVKKIDLYNRRIVISDDTIILLDEIIKIEGELFDN